MSQRDVALDSNMFLLYVVGLLDASAINKHKRLKQYSAESFGRLCKIISRYDRVLVTAGCLAEVSDLIEYDKRYSKQLFELLKVLLLGADGLSEEHVPARTIVEEPSYYWLGVTDTSYVELAKRGIPVITSDLRLYAQAVAHCDDSVNFAVLDVCAA